MPRSNKAPSATHSNVNPPVKDPAKYPHEWVGAATVNLTHRQAKRAAKYQSYRTEADEKIEVLEVYCSGCRRPIEDVDGQPCAALDDNRHLIGGDQTVRAKRKHYELPYSAVPLPTARLNRRGIDAVINNEL